jgi:hypothetical protein
VCGYLAGDLDFHSTRRMFLQAAASRGSKVYSYLLTQPQLLGDPSLGGTSSIFSQIID